MDLLSGGGFVTTPPSVQVGPSSLTALCSSGGCAAKYDGLGLAALLNGLNAVHPDLVVGIADPDDAAVYRLDDTSGIVASVDFFPPVVDDAVAYGRISANNAINDLYAMGARPAFALSIAAFPEDLPVDVASSVIEGAARQCELVGAILAGGHTIRSPEPKFGLAVIGFAALDNLWLKSGAKPGDDLYLTKPLGGGLILTGQRKGKVAAADLESAIEWMSLPAQAVVDVLSDAAPHAVTDVTGFGLLGHGGEMASAGGVRLVFEAERLPVMDGARRLAELGVRTSNHERNQALLQGVFSVDDGVDPALVAVALDPQTAGGMLVSLPAAKGELLQRSPGVAGHFTRIGSVTAGAGVHLAA